MRSINPRFTYLLYFFYLLTVTHPSGNRAWRNATSNFNHCSRPLHTYRVVFTYLTKTITCSLAGKCGDVVMFRRLRLWWKPWRHTWGRWKDTRRAPSTLHVPLPWILSYQSLLLLLLLLSSVISMMMRLLLDVSICFCPTPEPLLVVQSTSLLLYLHLSCPSISSVVFLGFFPHWYSRQTDVQTDKHTDRDRQTDRQTDRQVPEVVTVLTDSQ